MITIEQLRERLWLSKKTSTDWGKWVGSPTSWLALLLSSATAYFTLIHHSDDIRAVIGNRPKPFADLTQNSSVALGIWGVKQHLIVINSGNRAAAITAVILSLRLPLKETATSCKSEVSKALELEYVFDGVVVKPGEIKPIALDKFSGYGIDRVEDDTLYLRKGVFNVEKGTYVIACLSFGIITPDNVATNIAIPLYATKLRTLGEVLLTRYEPYLFKTDRPVNLLPQQGK